MIEFTIHFRGPFRVGGGSPVEFFDAPVDRDDPLPQSSLKGLMRAEACERLDIPKPWVERVFGSAAIPCPWWWSPVSFEEAAFSPTSKVRVDDVGRSMRGFLRFGEQAWATRGTFTVEQVGTIPDDEVATHRAILTAAAASVTSLGESRLKGSGWVDIRPSEPPPGLAAAILALTMGASA